MDWRRYYVGEIAKLKGIYALILCGECFGQGDDAVRSLMRRHEGVPISNLSDAIKIVDFVSLLYKIPEKNFIFSGLNCEEDLFREIFDRQNRKLLCM